MIVNQLNFATSCNFNNVNIFGVPKFQITEDESYPPFLSTSLKSLMIDRASSKKIISHNVVPRDPVYVAFDIGYTEDVITKDIYSNSYLEILRDSKTKISKEALKNKVIKIITDFFNPDNNALGGEIDISKLTTSILNIEGIKRIKTINNGTQYNGLSFISWNPLYEGVDENLITQSTTLPFFKFPYFYRPKALSNKILIIDNE